MRDEIIAAIIIAVSTCVFVWSVSEWWTRHDFMTKCTKFLSVDECATQLERSNG